MSKNKTKWPAHTSVVYNINAYHSTVIVGNSGSPDNRTNEVMAQCHFFYKIWDDDIGNNNYTPVSKNFTITVCTTMFYYQ